MATTALGFDFGLKYIGVASGQTVTKTATAITTVRAKNGEPNWQDIDKLISDYKPNILIVGLPLNMDDTESELSTLAREFADKLFQHTKIEVKLVDERLSSWEVKQSIEDEKNFDKLNADAAKIILNQWLQDN